VLNLVANLPINRLVKKQNVILIAQLMRLQ